MIEVGRMLAHYKLVEKIGEGGMGVVWKALDTTLNREVAIKILPEAFALDADRRARFEREARLLAALNHPGIAGVYGLHASDGLHFIAMEYVPGEDLAERLRRGPLSVDDAIDVGRQVAEALETAHEQGVIHRDLKPANIKLTPEGKIKVLDLGLARALATDAGADPGSVSLSPTVTSAGTVAGTLLGTAAYMSPEQVKGREVDRRADIWAFGCVLYEMLTARRAFGGETISETLASVLRDETEEENLPAETPAAVRRLMRRCLDRDRDTRLRDVGEARIMLSPAGLDEARELGGMVAATSVAPAKSARLPWVVAAIALVGLAAMASIAVGKKSPEPPPEIRAVVMPPEGQRFMVVGLNAGGLSLSSDGTKMTFAASSESGRPSLYLRTLGSTSAQIMSGTEGAVFPFWSPDSRQIAFFSDGKLKKLDLEGGAPLTVATAADGRGGTWGPDGTILFTPDTQSPIHRVSAGGVLGDPVTTLDNSRAGESTHRFPYFLPDGHHFLYVRGSHSAANQDTVNSIWVGDVDSDETVELIQSGTQAVYSQGHLFWVREGFLMARAFSADKLAFTGEPFAVGESIVVQPDSWRAAYSVSDAGPLAFHTGLAPERVLTWFDGEGDVLNTIGDPGLYSFIRLSPDDRMLAVTLGDASTGRNDIWVFDVQRKVGSRLTFHESNDETPVWSPDGTRIAFASHRNGPADIYVRPANGRGDAEPLYVSEDRTIPEDWSSDGKFLAFNQGVGKYDQWMLPLDGGDPFAFITGEFDEGYGRFSPDANWFAYVSNETARYELYLTRFPSGDGKWQLSKVGADWLLGWHESGSEIYYMDIEGKLCSVKVELGDHVVAELPTCRFEARANRTWDALSDGQRFVLGVPDDVESDFPVTLVLNWESAP